MSVHEIPFMKEQEVWEELGKLVKQEDVVQFLLGYQAYLNSRIPVTTHRVILVEGITNTIRYIEGMEWKLDKKDRKGRKGKEKK